jgi:hypothetical protein
MTIMKSEILSRSTEEKVLPVMLADIEQAASAMRKLADEPEYASALGQRASSAIRISLSPGRVGKLLAARLEQVSNAHRVQAMQSAPAKSSATTVESK